MRRDQYRLLLPSREFFASCSGCKDAAEAFCTWARVSSPSTLSLAIVAVLQMVLSLVYTPDHVYAAFGRLLGGSNCLWLPCSVGQLRSCGMSLIPGCVLTLPRRIRCCTSSGLALFGATETSRSCPESKEHNSGQEPLLAVQRGPSHATKMVDYGGRGSLCAS